MEAQTQANMHLDLSAPIPASNALKNRTTIPHQRGTMSQSNIQQNIVSTLAFGLIGAGLVYFGRRSQPGILASLATTTGYGMVTKAISGVVFAALDPAGV